MTLIFPIDEPYIQNEPKRIFVSLRIEKSIFLKLKEKAKHKQSDLSSLIRGLIKADLEGGSHD